MTGLPHARTSNYDVDKVRDEFPVLARSFHGQRLVYLDSANTTQKPVAVIDALSHFYSHNNANIHRGVYELSVEATNAYEGVRSRVAKFIGAENAAEIVFVRGATEAINLVAQTWGRTNIKRGEEIVLTTLEHHSNIVPWQLLCEQTGAVLKVAPISKDGDVIVDEFAKLLGDRTRLVAVSHVSNAIGSENPVQKLIGMAHHHGAMVLVDGAQAVPHLRVDVRALDADFYVFSSHKMYGPMGVGVLYAKKDLLEAMPPYQGGGDMIASVTFEKTTYNIVPHKFEAGTPNVAGVVGLGAAIDYLETLGMDNITRHENDVVNHAVASLENMPGVSIIGTPGRRISVVSFMIDGVHPHDAGSILDREAIAIRAGHHCSQPLMDFYGVPATNRASFGLYNSREDVRRLCTGIKKVQEVFA